MNIKPKNKPVRKLFCKREAEIDGKRYRFELRADGIHVRRWKSRKVKVLTFIDALQVTNGQELLKLT